MDIRLMAEKLGFRRVYKEDCELCIVGYTGKKCRYLRKIGKEFFCVKDADKKGSKAQGFKPKSL